MKGNHVRRGVLVTAAAALIVGATLAVAEPPAERGGPQRKHWQAAPREKVLPRPFRGVEGAPPPPGMMRPPVGMARLGQPPAPGRPPVNVNVEPQDDGAVILVTSDRPDVVRKIRQEVPARVEKMRQAAGEMRERWQRGERKFALQRERRERAGGRGFGMPFLIPFLAHEGVDVAVEPIDDGVAVRITSGDPDLAAKIREGVPRRVEMLKRFLQVGPQRMATMMPSMMGPMMGLLASGKVEVNFEPRPNGAALVVTSDDPKAVDKIRDALDKCVDMAHKHAQMVRKALEARKAREHPAPPAERRKLEEKRARETEQREMIRRIIREELQRFLRERRERGPQSR